MMWQLRVRKFFCRNAICPRRIFAERLPGVVAPWARRTLRLAAHLLAIGLALGGAAGVRLSLPFGLTVSRNTLWRVRGYAALLSRSSAGKARERPRKLSCRLSV